MAFAIRNFAFLLFLCVLAVVLAGKAWALEVQGIQLQEQSGSQILTIKLDQAGVKPNVFALKGPHRIVIDLPRFDWQVDEKVLANTRSTLVKRIRYARFDQATSRIVLDMHQAASFQPVTMQDRKRIGLLLRAAGQIAPKPHRKADFAWANRNQKRSMPLPSVKPEETQLPTSKARPVSARHKPLVMIDAGHGGRDSGAVGRRKTQEKHVTLRYARALRQALQQTGQFRVQLTRDNDKIIPLRERYRMARRQKADLFISLHADAAPNGEARGLSVYTLSEKASDKEAAALARQENKSDLLLEVDLTHEDDEVAGILIDLARRETKNKSVTLAEQIVKTMKPRINLLTNPHRHAGFAVLKAPDIPSVLVEIGFLTHWQEERLLNQKDHQSKVIDGLAGAITNYFAKSP